ncbi:Uncharacterised protein [Providencia stuartii]|nr:Uncharacterised protein [Providencia stuartii]
MTYLKIVSLFFIFRAIALPATDRLDNNSTPKLAGSLQIATGNTIKLFYRPVQFSVSQKRGNGLIEVLFAK